MESLSLVSRDQLAQRGDPHGKHSQSFPSHSPPQKPWSLRLICEASAKTEGGAKGRGPTKFRGRAHLPRLSPADMYRHMARASRSPWFAVLCLALVAVVSSARQVTAAPTICSRDPKEDLSGYTLLTQENLKANCVSFSAGNPKTPDCVLRQGGLFAVQSNLSVGSITIPWKTSLRFTDCGPLSRITFDAQHVIVDGSLVIGSRAVPYSGRLVITLHVGKEIKFGDYEPRAPGIAFDNKTNFGGLTVLEGTTNKFIGVRPGGQLDVFGMPKISWTRLSKTANEGQRYICVAERRATLNWTVGDELAISPTDFHGSRSTERTKITYLQRNNEATCGMNMTVSIFLAFGNTGSRWRCPGFLGLGKARIKPKGRVARQHQPGHSGLVLGSNRRRAFPGWIGDLTRFLLPCLDRWYQQSHSGPEIRQRDRRWLRQKDVGRSRQYGPKCRHSRRSR